jgi:phosphate transport system permease protein
MNNDKLSQIKGINKVSFLQRLKSYKRKPGSFILLLLVGLAALATTLCLGFIVCYILIKGIPNLTPDLFAWEYNSENVSMMPAIINTISMTLLSLLFSAPIGIFSAIYLVEYIRNMNQLSKRNDSYNC